MRAIWTGAISFGLVNIPVKMYSATQETSIDLTMLDGKNMAPIKINRVNADTNEEVEWGDVIKAYKYDNEYIPLSKEDMEQAYAPKSKLLKIIQFFDEDELDTMYYERPYFLEPDVKGRRGYALLREALRKSQKVGLASFVMRNRENIAVMRVLGKGIVVQKIRFAEELREINELDLPGRVILSDEEVDVAMDLISHYTKDLELAQFKDTYAEEILGIVKAKAAGKNLKMLKLKIAPTSKKDMVPQMKKSIEQAAS